MKRRRRPLDHHSDDLTFFVPRRSSSDTGDCTDDFERASVRATVRQKNATVVKPRPLPEWSDGMPSGIASLSKVVSLSKALKLLVNRLKADAEALRQSAVFWATARVPTICTHPCLKPHGRDCGTSGNSVERTAAATSAVARHTATMLSSGLHAGTLPLRQVVIDDRAGKCW